MRTYSLITILIIIFCINSNIFSSSTESEDDVPKIIRPINVKWCAEFADFIREDSARDYFESLTDEDETERCPAILFPTMIRTISKEESEEEKTLRIEKQTEADRKLRNRFIQDEIKIRDGALAILSQYPGCFSEYARLIDEEKLHPSIAILELTKNIQNMPRALELLELIENYADYDWEYYGFLQRDVGLEASDRIFTYYFDEYNKRASELPNPKEMDRHVHDLLHLCHKHMPDHPMSGVDDPECTMHHVCNEISKQLIVLNLWYLDNPRLVTALVDLYSLQSLFTLGTDFLQCTTYGIIPHYCDLGFLLKRKKFVGKKFHLLKDNSKYQHVWLHPYLPLQVRITEDGKLTVGLIKDNSQTKRKKIKDGSIDISNELYKIGIPNYNENIPEFEPVNKIINAPYLHLSGYIIPARHKLEQCQKLWQEGLEYQLKGNLMKEAHAHISLKDMDFEGMEKYLCIDQTATSANAPSEALSTLNVSHKNSQKSVLRDDSSTKFSGKKGKKKK